MGGSSGQVHVHRAEFQPQVARGQLCGQFWVILCYIYLLSGIVWGYADTMTTGRWWVMARGNNHVIRWLEFSVSLLNFQGGERRHGLELITNAQWLNQSYLCNGTSLKPWNNVLCNASDLVKESTCLEGGPNSTGPDAPVLGTLLVPTLGTSSPGCSFVPYIITR